MVNFGERLLESRHGPWSDYYIDYAQLKQVLEEESNLSQGGRAEDKKGHHGSNGSLSALLTHYSSATANKYLHTSEFLSVLYRQTEKVSFFVLQEQGRVSCELAACRQELLLRDQLLDPEKDTLRELILLEDKYMQAGMSLLKLIRFVELNVTGFRKILKKHDKILRTNLSLSYLALGGTSSSNASSGGLSLHSIGDERNLVDMGNQLVQPLLQNDTISALTVAYEAGIEDLRHLWQQYEDFHSIPSGAQGDDEFLASLDKRSRSITLPNLQVLDGATASNGATESLSTSTATTNNVRSHCDLQTMAMGLENNDADILARRRNTATTTSPGQILLQIHAARSRLHQTNAFIKMLAASAMVQSPHGGEDAISDTGDVSLAKRELLHHRPSRFSNLLNLLSTFFYMTNYYIVAPTSATYADKVGSNSSIASIIIGMTSVAALASTILYSYWTSYSYKSSLIFASTCSVIGNFLYAAGLPCQSLALVMLGRLLNGFGSARSINRRYIADSYSYAERTAASAAFVTATALGMAMGPALASILHLATEDSSSVYWQAENAPGWFMFVVWVIFLLCLIWKFEDPPRPHDDTSKTTSADNQNQLNGTSDEKRPLLTANADEVADDEPVPLCCNIPVIITLVVYMVLKMVLEAILSSESNLSALYFDWTGNIMGLHLTLLALLILPVNFGIAFVARWYFDRELIIGLLIAMLGGCVIIYQYQENVEDYTLAQYLIGSALLFVCASALEAPNMSLLSKVIPRTWRKGIINVGLLATESGTFGRVIGDALLAAMASHGLDTMLNEAFGAFAAIIAATLVACFVFYDHLEPPEKDD